tara:strand:- start:1048 stop:2190 length:1143 start_codon:yes stop_codon:yes gene_type:complete
MKILEITAVEFTFDKFISALARNIKSRKHCLHISFNTTEKRSKYHNEFTIKSNEIKRSKSLLSLIKAIYYLIVLFRKEKYSVIHTHTPIASIATRIACFFYPSSKLLYTVHGFYFHEGMNIIQYKIHFFIEYILSFLTHTYFFVSKEDYELAKRFRFSNPKNLFYIPNGVCPKLFSPANQSEKKILKNNNRIKDDSIVIGIASRLVEEKGYKELIQAIFKLLSKHPNMHLCICGSCLDSDYSNNVSKLLFKFKKEFPDRLSILGELSSHEMPNFYKTLDIFILPSWREGLPVSILEAMMTGLPVIATNIRGCREAVIDKVTGILVEPKNTNSIAKGIDKLVSQESLRESYGKNGRERALNYFELSKSIDLQTRIIESLSN